MTEHFDHLLDDVQRQSYRMAGEVEDMLSQAWDAVIGLNQDLARRVVNRDEEIDREEVEIEAEVLRLMTLFQPMGANMRQLCTILKVNNDLERIADCAVNIAERAYHLESRTMQELGADLKAMFPVVSHMLHGVLHAYTTGDRKIAARIRTEDETIDAFYGQFIRKLVDHAAASPEIIATHLDALSIAKNLERIADHATNIAEDIIYLTTGRIVRHRKEDET